MKYIDADKLIAEIERRLHFDNNWIEGDKRRQMRTSGVSSAYYKRIGSKHACESLLDFVISLQQEQPSLPSNLEEAAERIAWDIVPKYPDISWDNCFDKIKNGIKAGAEWMAGQYEKIEGDLVDWYSTSDGKDYCCGVKTIDAFEVPEGFYIRKKQ